MNASAAAQPESLRATLPELKSTEGGGFDLSLRTVSGTLHFRLSADTVHVLGLQCIAQRPALAPEYTVASVEEAYRQPARILKRLDSRSLQVLLRELHEDIVIDFLWYMKDADLIRQILANLSQRAAEMLMDDLSLRWYGKNPDTTLVSQADRGRKAVLEVMDIARQMAEAGQILIGVSE